MYVLILKKLSEEEVDVTPVQSQLSTSRANILERAFSDIDVASVSEHQSMTSVGTIPNLLPHSDEIAKPKSKVLYQPNRT